MEHNEVIRVVSIKDQVYQILKQEIIDCKLKSGEKLVERPRPGGHQAAHRRWSGCQYHQPRRLCQDPHRQGTGGHAGGPHPL